jgi:hypothetical protein
MNIGKLSRRQLLGGFVAGLASLLCPRPRRLVAALRQLATAAALRRSERSPVITYTYDAKGRLIRMAEHPPRPIESLPRPRPMPEQTNAFTCYDYARKTII